MDAFTPMDPKEALEKLKAGNDNFKKNFREDRNLLEEVKANGDGQTPFATVLSCIDSRMPAEMIFDQGVGDMFSIRIAGNFVNKDILGSMEFACRVSTTRLLVVMGHTGCGAVKGACNNVDLGNLTQMLDKIMPAVNAVKEPSNPDERNGANTDFVNEVAAKNVRLTIRNILTESEVLNEMHSKQEGEEDRLLIVGAMYNIKTGEVTFMD